MDTEIQSQNKENGTASSKESPGNDNKLTTRHIGQLFDLSDGMPRFTIETEVLSDEIGNVEIGSYVLIQYQNYAVLAQIVELSAVKRLEAQKHGRLKLLASIDLERCELIPGVSKIPSLGAKVYLASEPLVQTLFQPGNEDGAPLLTIGCLNTRQGIALSLSPDTLFSKHCVVVGTTGSGKSNTMAKIIEQCLKLRSKIILLDPSGEYSAINNRYVKHLHLGELDLPASQSKQVAVPYYHLTESDLMSIFKPTGQSQAPKLKAAIKSLKLAILSPNLAIDGNIIKADKEKRFFQSEYGRHIKAIDNPLAIVDISKLPQQIENECVKPTRSAVEPLFWGGINQLELAHCYPLMIKITDIITADELSPIFNPGKLPSLLDEIESFIGDPQHRVLRVSLETLPFIYNAREIVSNAIGRQILILARNGQFKKNPVVIMMDEAHQFLSEELEKNPTVANIDSMALIAKEGRKYGLSLCIATQRPRDIPESILSQFGTYIIHRIANASDRAILESASGELDESTLSMIPSLGPGKCLIMGAAVPFPLLTQIARPEQEPNSETPNFSDFWRI
jgi:DNA helicase HerA-like ATPase